MSNLYAVRKLCKDSLSDEGRSLRRVIGSFALLLGLTFLTLTLYLGNIETVTKVVQSYVVSFP